MSVLYALLSPIFVYFVYPRDHNENEVQLDLHYSIPATVLIYSMYLYVSSIVSFLIVSM